MKTQDPELLSLSLSGITDRLEERFGGNVPELKEQCDFNCLPPFDVESIRKMLHSVMDASQAELRMFLFVKVADATINSPKDVDTLVFEIADAMRNDKKDADEHQIAAAYVCGALHFLGKGGELSGDEGSYRNFRITTLGTRLLKEAAEYTEIGVPESIRDRASKLQEESLPFTGGAGIFKSFAVTPRQFAVIANSDGRSEESVGVFNEIMSERRKDDGQCIRTDVEYEEILAEAELRVAKKKTAEMGIGEVLRPLLQNVFGLPEGATITVNLKDKGPSLAGVSNLEITIATNPQDPSEFVLKVESPNLEVRSFGEMLRAAIASGRGQVIRI